MVFKYSDRRSQTLLGRARLLLLGNVSMNAPTSVWNLIGAVMATLLGTAFFFVIVGVFGSPAGMVALVLLIALALLKFPRAQSEGAGSPLLTALAVLGGYTVLGAGWLHLKSTGPLRSFAERILRLATPIFVALAAGVCITAAMIQPGVRLARSAYEVPLALIVGLRLLT